MRFTGLGRAAHPLSLNHYMLNGLNPACVAMTMSKRIKRVRAFVVGGGDRGSGGGLGYV